jgi:hypothetical protein
MMKSPVIETFNNMRLTIAGAVLASIPKEITFHDLRREITVYFGVTGAKRMLCLTRTPRGFKSRSMFQTLCRFYKKACIVREKPRPSKPGLKVSDDINSYFRKSAIQWVQKRTGKWTNDPRPFDSRTQEFAAFVSFLLSTPFRDENIVFIDQIGPRDPKDGIPKSFNRNETCIHVIKNTPWCLDIRVLRSLDPSRMRCHLSLKALLRTTYA